MTKPLEISENGELDATVISTLVQKKLKRVRLKTLSEKQGGLSGDFFKVECEELDGKTMMLVLKKTGKGKEAHAIALGTAREGKFFENFGDDTFISSVIPKCYFSYGDLASGIKQVLMKFEEGVPAGIYFGKGNPNNWAITDDEMATMNKNGKTPLEASECTFKLYARLHSRYWMDASMLSHEWLRGAEWIRGKGRDAWEKAQQLSADAWNELKSKENEKIFSSIFIDSHLIACLDASFNKCYWDSFQTELQQRPWTLVQSDAHPHNVLHIRNEEDRFILIDFEMVGIGSCAQELGQFLISHAEPQFRRLHEYQLVTNYHNDLLIALTDSGHKHVSYDFSACWSEYINGGAGRWIWFVPYLAKVCPLDMAIFFHNQLAAFLKDHFPRPEDVPMPRV
uniref:Aminoglycoside phosphotransferase domain-containing protein n=1 Tax=Aureoumbra lagunensis TaxID=44058 RepID=A0A7S3K0I6_9STRA|mmetsp:Transcript_5224/g.7748  ORF Transcript_5224/g.7748 Transcript_5224/m.7748 type:complete len:396 (+) Transcript_5224:44-1231(+)